MCSSREMTITDMFFETILTQLSCAQILLEKAPGQHGI